MNGPRRRNLWLDLDFSGSRCRPRLTVTCVLWQYITRPNVSVRGAAEDSSRRFAPFHPRLRVTVPRATSTCYPRRYPASWILPSPPLPSLSLLSCPPLLVSSSFVSKNCFRTRENWFVIGCDLYIYIYMYWLLITIWLLFTKLLEW